MNGSRVENSGFEYFWQEEAKTKTKVEALSPARTRAHGAKPSNFSLHGHRLSSLYRRKEIALSRLIQRYLASSCQKYSIPTPSSRKAV